MEDEKIIIVVEGGLVTEAYSYNANARIIIIDLDDKRIGERFTSELKWPDTQFDEERVGQLLSKGGEK